MSPVSIPHADTMRQTSIQVHLDEGKYFIESLLDSINEAAGKGRFSICTAATWTPNETLDRTIRAFKSSGYKCWLSYPNWFTKFTRYLNISWEEK